MNTPEPILIECPAVEYVDGVPVVPEGAPEECVYIQLFPEGHPEECVYNALRNECGIPEAWWRHNNVGGAGIESVALVIAAAIAGFALGRRR